MDQARWRQIDTIFKSALELSAAERAAFLARECSDDEELRAEVESLIEHAGTGSFMDHPAFEEGTRLLAADRLSKFIGQTVGAYEILEKIGEGGMGEVYLALHTRTNRRVALKLLPEHYLQDAQRVRRFEQEARAVLALNHPNIVTIYDIEHDAGAHFIVTELIEGKTLRQRMTRGQLNIHESFDIAIQVASALAAAHEAGIVHRDIKPENIMIRPDGYIKVLDFGIAKLTEKIAPMTPTDAEASTKKLVHTEAGMVIGTVSYMSPEQARGQAVDARTDIWSLGVVLYEMAAGRKPFEGETPYHVIVSIMEKEPPALSSRERGDVPNELEHITTKALAKDRAERYQTAKDLLVDLQQLKKHLEFAAELERTTSADKQLNAETKIQTVETRNSIAVLPFVNLSAEAEQEYFCDGLAEELLNALAKIEELKVAARTSAFSFKGKNANVSEIGRALSVQTVLEGSVRKSGQRMRITVQLVNAADGYQLWSERYDREMQDIFDVQDEITLAVVAALKVKLLGKEKAAVLKRYTDNAEAYLLYLKGQYYRWKTTPEEFGKCLKYFQQAVDADPTFALGYFGLATYYGYGSAWGLLPIPPHEGWAKAEAAIAKALEVDNTLPELHLSLAAFRLVNHREWAEAGRDIKRAADANAKFPEIHHLYSFYLVARGQFDEAIAEAQRALELDPLSLNYSRFLGICFYFARRYDEAVRQFREALELEPNNFSVHEILGEAYERKEISGEAVAEWQRAAVLVGDEELAAILGSALGKGGFNEAVRAVARKRLKRLDERSERGDYVPTIEYARAYVRLGDKEQAFEWLEKACEERNVYPLMIDSDPFYDSLRADPRFENLLRRTGLKTDGKPHGKSTNEVSEAPTVVLAPATTDAKKILTTADEIAVKPKLQQNQKARPPWLLIALLSLLIAAAGFFAYRSFTSNASKQIESIAVLPFVNESGNSDVEYLSDGMTESLINRLSQLPKLNVKARSSVFRYKGKEMTTRKVGEELDVQAIVTGRVVQRGNDLSLNVELVDASTENVLWTENYNRPMTNLIALQSEIARDVSTKLQLKLSGADMQKLAKSYTENTEAYQLYLKGRYHYFKLTRAEIRQSIGFYQQAIDVDPTYALAYAGMADAYRSLPFAGYVPSKEAFPQAKAAAKRALEIDGDLAEAHIALGWVGFSFDEDWNAAESELKKAIQLSPNNSDAHRAYAQLLSLLGRHTEAIAEVQRARELDPLTLITGALEGQFLFYAGRDDEAISRLKKTLEIEPTFWIAHNGLGRVYIHQGRYDEAVAELNRAIELSGGSTEPVTQLGYALAKSGKREQALTTLEEMKSLAVENYVPAYNFAMIYNGLGEKDEALKYLEKSLQEREVNITFIKIDTRWDELRDTPRFQTLLRRMNL